MLRWIARVLVPNWRFFEAEEARYVVEVRVRMGSEVPSPFMAAIPPVKRSLLSLVFSPEHNLRLACHDLVDRFVHEIAGQLRSAEEVETFSSWHRVRHMARFFVRAMHEQHAGLSFQLRLVALDDGGAPSELFLSPYYPLD